MLEKMSNKVNSDKKVSQSKGLPTPEGEAQTFEEQLRQLGTEPDGEGMDIVEVGGSALNGVRIFNSIWSPNLRAAASEQK